MKSFCSGVDIMWKVLLVLLVVFFGCWIRRHQTQSEIPEANNILKNIMLK